MVDMKIIDKYNAGDKDIYTVEIEHGYCVDIAVNSKTGNMYIMQCADGAEVYSAECGTDVTYPEFAYNRTHALAVVYVET